MKTLHAPRGAALLVVALASAGIAGCGDRESDLPGPVAVTETGLPSTASPSAVVIGVAPAEPTGDTVQTTPVASGTTEVSKPVEQTAMPLPGQPNDHSNLAAAPSQKAESEEVLKSPELAKAANGEKAERTQ